MLLLRPTVTSKLEIQYKTEPLRFNATSPVQVVRLPGFQPGFQSAEANLDSVACMAGDMVVFGSDGIFDNLSDQDIVEIVEAHCDTALRPRGAQVQPPSPAQLKDISDALVTEAIRQVRVPDDPSRLWDIVGNADDTTAMVAAIVEQDTEQQAVEDYFHSRRLARSARSSARSAASSDAGLFGMFFPHCCAVDVDDDEYEETHVASEHDSQHGCSREQSHDAQWQVF